MGVSGGLLGSLDCKPHLRHLCMPVTPSCIHTKMHTDTHKVTQRCKHTLMGTNCTRRPHRHRRGARVPACTHTYAGTLHTVPPGLEQRRVELWRRLSFPPWPLPVQENSCIITIGVAKNLDMLSRLIALLDPTFAEHLSAWAPHPAPGAPPAQGWEVAAVLSHKKRGSSRGPSRPREETAGVHTAEHAPVSGDSRHGHSWGCRVPKSPVLCVHRLCWVCGPLTPLTVVSWTTPISLPTEGKGAGAVQALFPWFCLCFQRAFKSFDDVWRLWEVSAQLGTPGLGPHPKRPVFLVSPPFLALDIAQRLRVFFFRLAPCSSYPSIHLSQSPHSLHPAPTLTGPPLPPWRRLCSEAAVSCPPRTRTVSV